MTEKSKKIDITEEISDPVEEEAIQGENDTIEIEDDTETDDTETPEDAVEDIETRLEKAEEEAKENYDRFLRVSAEFDNYKKRTSREMSEFRKYANESLIKELLSVVDNMERAIVSANSEENAGNGIIEGVDLTVKEILRMFDKYYVKPIQAVGEPFDPAFHQAVMQEESEDQPENTVLSELQKGYMIHDRLLRPAMVVVSKQKSEKTGGNDNNNDTKE